MPERIYPRRPPRLFLAEWREHYHLTQQQLADRLGTTDVTISRWETGRRRPDIDALTAFAEALDADLHYSDLTRPPSQESADALLRGQPPEVIDQALRVIKAIRR